MEVHAAIRYDKLRQIGVGLGMNSEVYLVKDLQTNATLAVKEVEKTKLGTTPAAYYSEARAMFASCRGNVVEVQFACETPTHVCLAMPYYAKGSLSERIARAPISIREAIRIGVGTLNGLAHIHTAGFVHFDIKPSNILFSDTDAPLVADFGQTRVIDSHGIAVIPPLYCFAMPPEFFLYGKASPASDVYQMGLTLYRAVNGDPFFDAQKPPATLADLKVATLGGTFPNRDAYLPHVPKAIRRIIRKALAISPIDRFQTAREFSDALGAVPVRIDWALVYQANGDLHWQAARDGQPDLLVVLAPGAATNCRVEVYTVSSGIRRAKGRTDFWRSGLTFAEADAHLRQVFHRLS